MPIIPKSGVFEEDVICLQDHQIGIILRLHSLHSTGSAQVSIP